jgi:very-short-patch-repair endonuclease
VQAGATHGLTDKRLRAGDLDKSVWGIRASAIEAADLTPLQQLLARCRMFALRMPPDAFVSHSTAALLYGVPLPFELERSDLVHLAVAAPARAPHAAGIRGHQLTVTSHQLQRTGGITLTNPARTWCDLSGMLSLHDLVAAGDFLIHWSSPHTSIAALTSMSGCFVRQRGAAKLSRALPLLNDRAESRPESVLRVVLELGGLPQPRINREIVFADDGDFVRTDFAFDEYRVLLEYQGDYHRTKAGQWRKDMTRRSRLEAAGWFVMEINADDLKHPDELLARIRSVLRQRGYRG